MKIIVDCSYLCYRSLHTMRDLSYDQKQVGIIFGFVKQIFGLAKEFNTKDFIFCWDSRKSYRQLIYPEYKANRRKDLTVDERLEMDQAYAQFDDIREIVLPMMGFKNVFVQTGYESDDLIAWIVMRFPDDYLIASNDNDMLQLLHAGRFTRVRQYNFKFITDENDFEQTWFGLKPSKWVSVKAIAGCSTDNVKGIDGVGETTAAKYLAGVLKGTVVLGKITSDEGKKMAAANVRLVALPFAGPRPIRVPQLLEDDIDVAKFKAIFSQYGFRSLLKGEEIAKWSVLFFGGEDGREHGSNPVRKIQRF